MPLNTCSNGLVATALVALLLLPAQYFVPERYAGRDEPLVDLPPKPDPQSAWFDRAFSQFPPLDLFLTAALILLVFFTYLLEWIQRKIMERRIMKLNQHLGASLKRLRAWDARQEQLDVSLRMVQNATVEYNLLLYLLLRHHPCLNQPMPPSDCFYDKELDNFSCLRNPSPLDSQPL